jgi:hypothetical protein
MFMTTAPPALHKFAPACESLNIARKCPQAGEIININTSIPAHASSKPQRKNKEI